MLNYIEFADGTQFPVPDQPTSPIENRRTDRAWKAITITGTVEEAKAAFIDNAQYSHWWESQKHDKEGNLDGTEMRSEDLSDYCVAGDIVDTRDGNVIIYMGKKNTDEIIKEKDATIASLQAEVATKEAFIAAKEVELAAVKAEPIKKL